MNKTPVLSDEFDEDEAQTSRKDLVIAAAKVAVYVAVPVVLTVATNIVLNKMKKS